MGDENKTPGSPDALLRESRLAELIKVLSYLELYPASKLFFDKNGSRGLY